MEPGSAAPPGGTGIALDQDMQLKLPIAAFSTTFLLSLGWGLGCGASSELSFECKDSTQPDQGFASCESGLKHRPEIVACQLALPRPGIDCGGGFDPSGCNTDSDCTEAPNGYCVSGQVCYCTYACKTDADCADGQLCECRGSVSACVPAAGCKVDADCPGSICATHLTECGGTGYSCVTDADDCTTNADCKQGQQCLYNGSRRYCGVDTCVEGRPFYVDGHIRTAPLEAGASWSDRDVCRHLETLDLTPGVRQLAQDHYLEMAAMEHASVAAFARFTLQLMSLGAPANLVDESQKALADELRHARLAFGIAERLGVARQPAKLDVSHALDDQSPWNILHTTLMEGCIGETIAAARMLEASLLATDSRLSAALAQVAEDETRHATLAWRSVAWLLRRNPELAEPARQLLARTVAAQLAEPAESESMPREVQPHAEQLGVLSDARGRLVAHEALRHIVRPTANALFSRLSAAGPVQAATV